MKNYICYENIIQELALQERYDLIVELVEFVRNTDPPSISAINLVAMGYNKAKRYLDSALAAQFAFNFKEVVESEYYWTAFNFNAGKSFRLANQPIRAVEHLTAALKYQPNDVDTLIELAVAYYAKNEKDKAEEILTSIKTNSNIHLNDEDRRLIDFNLATHKLRRGDVKNGLKDLQIGRELNVWGAPGRAKWLHISKWDGVQVDDLLIVGEGGIGDELISFRYGAHCEARGMRPSFMSSHGLANVLKQTRGAEYYQDIFDAEDDVNLARYSAYVPGMDAAAMLKLEKDELWQGHYYLQTGLQKPIITEEDSIKIGIKWSGNPLYEQDLYRTIPINDVLNAIRNRFPDRCIEFVSFQLEGASDIEYDSDTIDLSTSIESFADTFGYLNQIDVMVSSCTSIVHAAAAAGVETIVLTPIMAYHTWGDETIEGSHWYGDNLHVARQVVPNSWSSAIETMLKHIETRLLEIDKVRAIIKEENSME